MSKTLPTAEEFIEDELRCYEKSHIIDALIKFARIHVQEALESRDRLYETYYAEELKFTDDNKEFIKKSYPLTNIK